MAVARLTAPAGVAIKHATREDAARVGALGARLFVQAYGPTHPEPELSRYLARSFAVRTLEAELETPGTSVLVAQERSGRDIGYAYLRATAIGAPQGVRGTSPLEIARFYVDEAWHGRGVAQALMAACVADARARGADALWLQVWTQASRPLAFYRRMGFEVVGRTTFAFGDRLDDDHVMLRRLDP